MTFNTVETSPTIAQSVHPFSTDTAPLPPELPTRTTFQPAFGICFSPWIQYRESTKRRASASMDEEGMTAVPADPVKLVISFTA